MRPQLAFPIVHNSRALLRVAKAFLDNPKHDSFDLADTTQIKLVTLNNLLSRMAGEGWLSTDDGWCFQLTSTGRRALMKLLCQRTFKK